MPWRLWRRKRNSASQADGLEAPQAHAEEAPVAQATDAAAVPDAGGALPHTADLYLRNWAFIAPALQNRLANTTLLTAGAGLGSVIAVLAARTGVQRFILADGDVVEESNLNRQAFTRVHLGQNKAEATAAIIADIQPNANIEIVPRYLDATDCAALVPRADIILNTIDFDSLAFLELNRVARAEGKPVLFPLNPAWMGTLMVFTPDGISLDEFLGIEDPTQPQSAQDITLRFAQRIFAGLPGGIPDSIKPLLPLYREQDPTTWKGDPQLGVTAYLTAALAVRALVALVAHEPVRVAPQVITADAFTEVAPLPVPIRQS